MQSKFYTLGLSCCIACLMLPRAYSQTPPTASPITAKQGYIRFWNMLPPANGTFILRPVGSASSGSPFLSSATSYSYSSYAGKPAAKYRLDLIQANAPDTPLKSFEVDLKQNSYFTVVVVPKSGAVDLEVTEDTIDRSAASGTLTIRNYFPGATVVASRADAQMGTPLGYGQSYRAEDLPRERLPLKLSIQLPAGVPIKTGVEPDLKVSSRATVLIIPDSYGKVSSIVTFDGKNL